MFSSFYDKSPSYCGQRQDGGCPSVDGLGANCLQPQ
jgi:hypothetical protein